MPSIPVTILHGFLGSGKTTFLRNILQQADSSGIDLSVIVNDMSELDVDGVLILNTDAVSEEQGNFVTISGDSISSPSGVKQLDKALKKLCAEKWPEWIVIETSGSSHPLPLVEYFKNNAPFALKDVITLVDATWLRDDYRQGSALIPKWQENVKQGVRGVENLLVEQIMFSNRVMLTKTDKVDDNTVRNIAQGIHPLNVYTEIIKTSWGNLDIRMLKGEQDYNFFLVEQLIAELRETVNEPLNLSDKDEQSLVAKVIKDDRPFHPARLWSTCHQYLTKGVFRSKGFFWFPTRDDVSLLWSQASGNVGLEITGFWRASVINDESQNFTEEHRQILQDKIDSVESRFGDRRCRLTVIGQENEVDVFIDALENCFLTDAELEQWQQGATFEDPWPKKIAKLSQKKTV
ncbi:GTP-binding protein [Vibrio sp. 2094]|uniref:CobW family GTP-binding protein n=1 Tax=unclassified Vibrio TaxID=2614977 RepID=UPI00280DAA25|nr:MULTISPECIES: GTP-binding protein [unclassified Vibrio]ELB2848484.1 GTP-binding protein [Vibrio alginolyticus]MDW2071398.1 GTP-binding protein [Vibrio sp. 2096]MDW2173770.1 GTP-binding protein [Vibrio sp. 1637]MDW3142120.1 GTP-binding protein [Vibrio sp. 2094]